MNGYLKTIKKEDNIKNGDSIKKEDVPKMRTTPMSEVLIDAYLQRKRHPVRKRDIKTEKLRLRDIKTERLIDRESMTHREAAPERHRLKEIYIDKKRD